MDKADRLKAIAASMRKCAQRWDTLADEMDKTGRVASPKEFQMVVASCMSTVCNAVATLAEIG